MQQTLDFLWLEITSKCNLTCSHCYADSNPHKSFEGQMFIEDWKQVIREAASMGCKKLQFIGGEPTIHPHFKELLYFSKEQGFEFIEVFTNATKIGSEIINCFRENDVHVATSFYTTNSNIHDSITSNHGSWNRTTKGIRQIIDAKLPIRIGIIEMEENKNNIGETITFLKGIGANNIGIDKKRSFGRGDSSSKIEKTSDEENYEGLCGQCWKQRLCVTAEGDVYPCVFSRSTFLGKAKDGLSNCYDSAVRNEFSKKMQQIEKERMENLSQHTNEGSSEENNSCYPSSPCSPQVCSPTLPCAPQNFCNPDAGCQPQYRIEGSQAQKHTSDICSPDGCCIPCIPF